MIVAERKPLEEILASIGPFRNILLLGCGTCVSVCLTGGDREAHHLARQLEAAEDAAETPRRLDVMTVERQCERDMVKASLRVPRDTQAILSLGCGAGVQTLADIYEGLPVLPALNTTFLGACDAPGTWTEKCVGCGDCVLGLTGGICPVARCAKHLFNGPCGGSKNGKCEVNEETDCAWHLILKRLALMGKLNGALPFIPCRDWSKEKGGGPRKMWTPDKVSAATYP